MEESNYEHFREEILFTNQLRDILDKLPDDETRERFLVVQERNKLRELPGGGLDHGELPRDCLKREIKEEMGIEVTFSEDSPSFFLSCEKKIPTENLGWQANVLYKIQVAHLNFTPSEECVAVRFVTPEEALSLPAFPNVHAFAKLFGKSQSR